jgi:hypothetical protein
MRRVDFRFNDARAVERLLGRIWGTMVRILVERASKLGNGKMAMNLDKGLGKTQKYPHALLRLSTPISQLFAHLVWVS